MITGVSLQIIGPILRIDVLSKIAPSLLVTGLVFGIIIINMRDFIKKEKGKLERSERRVSNS